MLALQPATAVVGTAYVSLDQNVFRNVSWKRFSYR